MELICHLNVCASNLLLHKSTSVALVKLRVHYVYSKNQTTNVKLSTTGRGRLVSQYILLRCEWSLGGLQKS